MSLNVPFHENKELNKRDERWTVTRTNGPILPDQLNPILSANPHLVDKPTSLSAFLGKIKSIVDRSCPKLTWVSAEIVEIKEINDNCYLKLAEYSAQSESSRSEIAKVDAKIWKSTLHVIKKKFYDATSAILSKNIKVMLCISVDYHVQYGFSLIVRDIDPTYTVGNLEERLKRIRKNLTEEGIFNKNKQLSVPGDFVSLAVISPAGAAGLGDFQREADLLEKSNLCHFKYFTAIFQGDAASVSIASVFDSIIQSQKTYDAIVIIRGGGATTDLASLNDIKLARIICNSPLPVFTGIGHEKDSTILDEVSCVCLDTPSKVSHYILNKIFRNAQEAERAFTLICQRAEASISKIHEKNTHYFKMIYQSVHMRVHHFEKMIEHNFQGLGISKRTLLQYELSVENHFKTHCQKTYMVIKELENSAKRNYESTLMQSSKAIINQNNKLSNEMGLLRSAANHRADSLMREITHNKELIKQNMSSLIEKLKGIIEINYKSINRDAGNIYINTENGISNKMDFIRSASSHRGDALMQEIIHDKELIRQNVTVFIERTESVSAMHYQNIKRDAKNICSSTEKTLEAYFRGIVGQGPMLTLKRGFTITSDEAGKILHSYQNAMVVDKIQIDFYDGKLWAVPYNNVGENDYDK